jgi:hypothetical protein
MPNGSSRSISASDRRGRRLRPDAMKGMVMAHRLLIASCLAAVAACCAMVGVVWSQSTREAAQAAEANRRLADLLTQTQATNQEMLKQLQAVSKPAESPKSRDWIPVKFKLATEKPDGPPAAGFEAWLGQGNGGSIKEGAIHRLADTDGLIDFGVVPPGDWEYRLESTGSSTQYWKLTSSLNVLPGASVSKQIICPKVPPELVSVHIKIDWPSDLADKDLYAVGLFECHGPRYQPPRRWGLWNAKQMEWQRRQVVIGSPSNQRSIEIPRKENLYQSPYVWRFPTQGEKEQSIGRMLYPQPDLGPECSTDPDQLFANIPADSIPQSPDRIDFEMGEYSLERLLILQPHADPKTASGWHSFLVLSLIQPEENSTFFNIVSRQSHGIMQPLSNANALGLAVAESYWRDAWGRFWARPGQVNEWTIPLPDELVKSVRAKLKAGPKPAERLGSAVQPPRS